MEVTFESLGLSDAMLKALEKKGYGYPTTIQAEAIPHFMQWKDVIAKAPTGTGKTFAFGIPMIEHVDPAVPEVQGRMLCISSRSIWCWPAIAWKGRPCRRFCKPSCRQRCPGC